MRVAAMVLNVPDRHKVALGIALTLVVGCSGQPDEEVLCFEFQEVAETIGEFGTATFEERDFERAGELADQVMEDLGSLVADAEEHAARTGENGWAIQARALQDAFEAANVQGLKEATDGFLFLCEPYFEPVY